MNVRGWKVPRSALGVSAAALLLPFWGCADEEGEWVDPPSAEASASEMEGAPADPVPPGSEEAPSAAEVPGPEGELLPLSEDGEIPQAREAVNPDRRDGPHTEEAVEGGRERVAPPDRPLDVEPTAPARPPELVPRESSRVGSEGWARTSPRDQSEGTGLAHVESGAVLLLSLEEVLSGGSHRPGDTFHARVAEDVMASDGRVAVPEGSRVQGRVAASGESGGGVGEEGPWEVVVEALLLGSDRLPLVATVTEGPPTVRDADGHPVAEAGSLLSVRLEEGLTLRLR